MKDSKLTKWPSEKITKLEVLGSLILDYTTNLWHSQRHGTGTKTDTSINRTEQKAQK